MFKRLSLYSLLLLTIPLLGLIGIFTNPHHYGLIEKGLYFITQSAGKPYALLSCGFLASLYFLLIKNKKTALKVIAIMALMTILSQGVKSVLKPLIKEERPFITQEMKMNTSPMLYSLDKKSRQTLVSHYYQSQSPALPQWLIKHRSEEVSYSLPSGHSLFAATWVMLALGFALLFPQLPALMTVARGITLWALLVLISRLQLGMHFPLDEMVAILISWVLNVSLFYFLMHKKLFSH